MNEYLFGLHDGWLSLKTTTMRNPPRRHCAPLAANSVLRMTGFGSFRPEQFEPLNKLPAKTNIQPHLKSKENDGVNMKKIMKYGQKFPGWLAMQNAALLIAVEKLRVETERKQQIRLPFAIANGKMTTEKSDKIER